MKNKLQFKCRHWNSKLLLMIVALLGFAHIMMAADYTIYFERPSTWSNTPHIHMWGNVSVDNQAMTDAGNGWYSYKITTTATSASMKFNNGGWSGGQTNDESWSSSNSCYKMNSSSNVESTTCPTFVTYTYYLEGFNDWGNPIPMTVTSGVASCSKSLTGGTTYAGGDQVASGFKIKKVGSDESVSYYGANGTMTASNCTDWQLYSGSSNYNIGITTTATGDYTFSFNTSSSKLSVTYPCGGKSAPDNVVDGTKVMCYISQPWDNMFLTHCTTGEVGSHTRIDGTNAIVTKDAEEGTYNIGISNSSGWAGACMDNQSDALLTGSYYVADGSHNVNRTDATTLNTFTASSESITEGTASITLTLKNSNTKSSYNKNLTNLIYVDDVMVDCAAASTSNISKTLNTSAWAVGNHTVKIILADDYIYYIGGTKTITVTSPCTTPSTPEIESFNYASCTSAYVKVKNGTVSSSNSMLLVRYVGSSPSLTNPTNGQTYSVGATLGDGTVVYAGAEAAEVKDEGLTNVYTNYTYALYQYTPSPCFYYSAAATKTTVMTSPAVTTADATSIGSGTATLGGSFTARGRGGATLEYGVIWTETIGGKTKDQEEVIGTTNIDPGSFSKAISFDGGATYKYKAYVKTNSGGTCEYGYGTEKSVTVPAACTTPTASDFTVSDNVKTYNGNPQSATVAAKSGITGMGAITVKYNGSATAPTNAGTYSITIDVAAGTTYCAATINLGVNLTINKKNQTALTFAGSTQCLNVEVTLNATGGESGQAITYTKKSGTGTVSGNKLTTSAAGTVVVTATRPGGTNYNDVTADASFIFNGVSVTQSPTTELYPYKPITFTASGSASWTLTTASETAYISTASGTSTVLKAAVGTYTVTATASECATQKSVTVVADPDNCQ